MSSTQWFSEERTTRESTNAPMLVQLFFGTWMSPGKRRAINKEGEAVAILDKAAKLKAGVSTKVKYPYRIVKGYFRFIKFRYRELIGNTNQLFKLFA